MTQDPTDHEDATTARGLPAEVVRCMTPSPLTVPFQLDLPVGDGGHQLVSGPITSGMQLQHTLLTYSHMRRVLHLAGLLMLCVIGVWLIPAEAFASATNGGGLPYETWLGTLRNSITGPVAFTVAIVALVGTGSALIFQGGEMNTFLRSTIYFILVIALVISAQNIMSGLFGKGAVAMRDESQPYGVADFTAQDSCATRLREAI